MADFIPTGYASASTATDRRQLIGSASLRSQARVALEASDVTVYPVARVFYVPVYLTDTKRELRIYLHARSADEAITRVRRSFVDITGADSAELFGAFVQPLGYSPKGTQ